MDKLLERLVWERVGQKCEYCLLSCECTRTEFEVDHIIPLKHRGKTTLQNLALTCFYCNSYKGPNLSCRGLVD
jgi:5-methylcytosine-specific restriction endonuclease McrA